jgi:hypothetical protein
LRVKTTPPVVEFNISIFGLLPAQAKYCPPGAHATVYSSAGPGYVYKRVIVKVGEFVEPVGEDWLAGVD